MENIDDSLLSEIISSCIIFSSQNFAKSVLKAAITNSLEPEGTDSSMEGESSGLGFLR